MAVRPSPGFSLGALGRSALIMTGATAAAQVLGMVRELYLAAQVGVSPELDALYIALVLPTTLAGVLTSGVMTALVPTYLRIRTGTGPREARAFAGAVLLWVAIGGLAVTILLTILTGPAVTLTGPGLAGDDREAAIGYLRLLAPLAFIGSVSAILHAVCQAEERFAGMAAADLIGPVVALAVMIGLWDQFRLTAVAIGSLLGPTVTTLVLYATTLRARMAPRPTLRLPGHELSAFLRHAGPLTLSAAILQVNTVADRAIASLLVPGGVSALRFAEILVRAPIGMIAPAWGNVIYPALVRAAHSADETELGRAATRTVRFAVAIFMPVTALTAAVAPVAVMVAYGRGAFSADDLRLTAPIVAAFAPLIVILMVSPVLTSAHNARLRGRVLLIGGTLNAVLNLILDIVLGVSFGVVGIALSSSITSALVLAYFASRLAADELGFDRPAVTRTLIRAATAAVPPALLAGGLAWGGWLPDDLVGGLVVLFTVGTLGSLAYAALAGWALGLAEVRTIARAIAGRVMGARGAYLL